MVIEISSRQPRQEEKSFVDEVEAQVKCLRVMAAMGGKWVQLVIDSADRLEMAAARERSNYRPAA